MAISFANQCKQLSLTGWIHNGHYLFTFLSFLKAIVALLTEKSSSSSSKAEATTSDLRTRDALHAGPERDRAQNTSAPRAYNRRKMRAKFQSGVNFKDSCSFLSHLLQEQWASNYKQTDAG